RYPYDPAKARALLDAAGWHAEGDGIRRNAAGQRLSLELQTTSGNRIRELIEEVLQSEWRQVGIEVPLRNLPPRVLFGDSLLKRKFTMMLLAWISAPENDPRSLLRSDEIPTAANGYNGENSGGFRNAEVDRLIDAIEVELDRDRRAALWHRLERLYAEELPALPLFFRADAYVLPKWLEGVVPTGQEAPTTLWIEDWRVVGRVAG
ncbi:MAG TPA: ABC transporter substrate-binding protein, partial [Stellaceae bacterium]|nr:ABC transporter substrate-binding protein [Stellaceae bacterium]